MKLVLSCCLILCCIWLKECTNINKSKACYQAKICIHNNNEKCGVNSNGRLRRFLDSCDILEYNCLRGTDFDKTTYENCSKLPPMKKDGSGPISAQSDTDAPKKTLNGEAQESEETSNESEKQLTGDEQDDLTDGAQLKHVYEEDQADIAEQTSTEEDAESDAISDGSMKKQRRRKK